MPVCVLFGLAGPKMLVMTRTAAQPELHAQLVPAALELRRGDEMCRGEVARI